MPIPLKEVRRIEMSNSSSRGLIPFRFGRAMFDANPEMVGGVMASCAKLVDSGIIKSTATTKFKSLTEIKEAIKVQMSGKAMKEIGQKGD